MDEPRRFWMVKGLGPSSFMHESPSSAEDEAERLARENPGQRFYVLEAVSAFRRVEVERITFRDEDEELPF